MPTPTDAINSNHAQRRPTRNTRRKNFTFKGIPKCYLANIDALDLRQSLRIAALHRKQLDPTLNNAGFAQASHTSEKDVDPLKEHCTFKKAIESPYKGNFASAMVHEMNKHTTSNH